MSKGSPFFWASLGPANKLERDLFWLLDRDPATLGADQRQIREYVAGVVKDSLPGNESG